MRSARPRLRRPPIRITPDVYRAYQETIEQHPPETFAILGGYLDDPYLVTDFRFCPPLKKKNGADDASATHINVDHDYMNFVVDREWKPNSRYMVGLWHSHPPGASRPSIGDATTNTGDIAFFKSCLANDDSPGRDWRTFLAPITTFDADNTPHVHGWVLKRGATEPEPTLVVLDPLINMISDELIISTTANGHDKTSDSFRLR